MHSRAGALIEIDQYRATDRDSLDQLYRRVLGDEGADALAQRWDWLYLDNPNLVDGAPLIWVARDGAAVVGQYATIPVKLQVNGAEIDAAWGTDVMVSPDYQRRGLGSRLLEICDQNVGASIGLGLTDASHAAYGKLSWPNLGRVPRFVKRLTTRGGLAKSGGRVSRVVTTLTQPLRRAKARLRPLGGAVQLVEEPDARFTRLWERVAPNLAFGVRRDAAYLTWRYVRVPRLRYFIAALVRDGEVAGFVVYRHLTERARRVTIIVDFLADPAEPAVMSSLLRWVEREAYASGSDLIRVFATHRGFTAAIRAEGYEAGSAGMRFIGRINSIELPATFYDSFDSWHVTRGDSDADQ